MMQGSHLNSFKPDNRRVYRAGRYRVCRLSDRCLFEGGPHRLLLVKVPAPDIGHNGLLTFIGLRRKFDDLVYAFH